MSNQTFSLQPFPSADTQLLPHPVLTDTPLLNKERGRGEVLINKERGRGEVLNPTSCEPISNLKITGNIARQANQFTIQYALVGDLKEVAIPTPSDTPARKHELWKDTCFEFFLGCDSLIA